jgi:Zn-dependent protease with chaperone function
MAGALALLSQVSDQVDSRDGGRLNRLKIAAQDRWLALFASHPPLEARIRALQALEPAETAMHWLR